MDDQKLLTYLKVDNELAFEGIFRKYFIPLTGFANGYMDDREQAKDIVQAVLLNIWEQRESLQIHTALKSYLFNAVRNSCLNELQRNKTKQKRMEGLLTETADAVNSRMEYAELRQQIYAAIQLLPEECKRIFILSRFEKLKYSEIATRLGISVKTVEAQISKALRVLRIKLASALSMLLMFLKLL
ncbi:RNA polymerase sigma-70 factor [Chitinophaga silvatica]|uniref:RNA polymerase sigma-70 factor n=1 Tax=Chitinophaga silvatica TaxID=2282649 RepID=A0A3E1Y245_9BACT|nr:RNA polymerase sigma-70 factor [Chitinophaga silvatica]RFS18696.1 RNA polymerase sigma-70 factor [Chitinophaga silvatica]